MLDPHDDLYYDPTLSAIRAIEDSLLDDDIEEEDEDGGPE